MSLTELFNNIAEVGSPREKLQLLKEYPYQNELKEVLKLAIDPFITFGITDIHEVEHDPSLDPSLIFRQLANRELTGNEAKRVMGAATHPEDRELCRRILRKDLRCGVGEKLVLQLYPGLLRQFDVMRAKEYDGITPRRQYRIEPKYDGLRCIAFVERGVVRLFSRNGKEFTSSDHLKEQLFRMPPGVYDGELISGNFNSSVSAVKKKGVQNDSTNYHIFDYLDHDEWKNPIKPYSQRRATLELAFKPSDNLILTPSFQVHSEEEVMRFYQQFLDYGYEGAILKNVHGLYRFKRHADWMKLKEQGSVDLVVESLVQGEGKYYGMLGAVIVRYNGKRVNVGSGFSDRERAEFWKNPKLIVHKTIEVHYHQITPDGSLRHPRFHCIREDKSI